MIQAISTAPNPLKEHFFIRLLTLLLSMALFIAASILAKDIVLSAACMLLLIGITLPLISLVDIIRQGSYLVIEGVCLDYTNTGLRRRIKRITLSTPNGTVELRPKETVKIKKDSRIRIYLRSNTRIYFDQGKRIILDYIAIESPI